MVNKSAQRGAAESMQRAAAVTPALFSIPKRFLFKVASDF
jgi:hypothetical protein